MKGYLQVSKGHELYYEVYGNETGIPILFLHGGPGAGFLEVDKRFFDPKVHKVVFFDQRGAARSRPFGDIVNNDTDLLLEDIIALLAFLRIEKVMLFAGSWGCTLGLLYAIRFPNKITGIILRGVFLGNKDAIVHYVNGGVKKYYPEEWERFERLVPVSERKNIPKYYLQQMLSETAHSDKYAYEWAYYEISIYKRGVTPEEIKTALASYSYRSLAILEAHYLSNGCFIEDNYILNHVAALQHIPISIVQGRYDVVCPPIFAYQLHQRLGSSKLTIVEAGHADSEPEIEEALKKELDLLVASLSKGSEIITD